MMARRLYLVSSIALAAALAIVIASPSAPARSERRGGTLFTLAPGFSTTLLGGYEVGTTGQANAGDRDGKGWATVALVGPMTVCYSLIVTKIGPATGAHIHRGRPGVNGAIVVPLRAPTHPRGTPQGLATSSGCVATPESTVSAIRARPNGFYVNVHTADFAGGAIRGQL